MHHHYDAHTYMKNTSVSFMMYRGGLCRAISLYGHLKHEQNHYIIQLPDRDLLVRGFEMAYRRTHSSLPLDSSAR